MPITDDSAMPKPEFVYLTSLLPKSVIKSNWTFDLTGIFVLHMYIYAPAGPFFDCGSRHKWLTKISYVRVMPIVMAIYRAFAKSPPHNHYNAIRF